MRETAQSDFPIMHEDLQQKLNASISANDVEGIAKYAKSLGRIGGALSVLGVGPMADEAYTAFKAGKTEEARQIIEKFAA